MLCSKTNSQLFVVMWINALRVKKKNHRITNNVVIISSIIENCPTVARKELELQPMVGSGQAP